MTVNTTKITSGPYVGNGIADTFSYGFKITDKDNLSVYETDDLGTEVLLTVDTDYTVAGVGVDGGGTVTRVAGALPAGYQWYIRSNVPPTQLTAFASQGAFFPDLHENALDDLTVLIQQLLDSSSRTPKLSDSYTGTLPISLDDPVAGAYLSWNLAGDAVVNAGAPGSVVPEDVEANVAGMIANTSLLAGQLVRTKGYYSQGDGGHADYLVKTAAQAALDGDVIDGYGNFTLVTGDVAILQSHGGFTSQQYGAYNDPLLDSTDMLNAAFAQVGRGGKVYITGKHMHTANLACVTSGPVDIEFVGEGEIITDATMTDQVALWVSHLPYLEDITQYYDPANRAGGTGLAVNAARGDRVIEVIDGSIFSKGDYLYLISTVDWLASASIKKGEIRKVNSVSGNFITLDGGLDDSYTFAGVTCYPYNPPQVTIKNPRFTGPDGGNDYIGVHLYECVAVDVSNPTITGYNLRDLQMYFVSGAVISNPNNDFADKSYAGGGRSSYSLVINGSRDVKVLGGALRGGRHAFSTGGYIPNYNIGVSGVVGYSSDPFGNDVACFDFHEGTVNSYIRDCTVYGGIDCAGENLDISRNTVYLSGELLRSIVVRVYRNCEYIYMDNNRVYATDCVGGVVLRHQATGVLVNRVSQSDNKVIMTTAFNRPGIGLEPNGVTGSQVRLLAQNGNLVDVRGTATNAIGIGNYDVGDLTSLVSISHTECRGNVVYNEVGVPLDYYCSDKNDGVISGNRFEAAVATYRSFNLRNFRELDFDNNHCIMTAAALAANSHNLFRDIDKVNIYAGSITNSYYNGYRLLNVGDVNPVNLSRVTCTENPADRTRASAPFVIGASAASDATGTSTETYGCSVSKTGTGIYLITLDETKDKATGFHAQATLLGTGVVQVNYNNNGSYYVITKDLAGTNTDIAFTTFTS